MSSTSATAIDKIGLPIKTYVNTPNLQHHHNSEVERYEQNQHRQGSYVHNKQHTTVKQQRRQRNHRRKQTSTVTSDTNAQCNEHNHYKTQQQPHSRPQLPVPVPVHQLRQPDHTQNKDQIDNETHVATINTVGIYSPSRSRGKKQQQKKRHTNRNKNTIITKTVQPPEHVSEQDYCNTEINLDNSEETIGKSSLTNSDCSQIRQYQRHRNENTTCNRTKNRHNLLDTADQTHHRHDKHHSRRKNVVFNYTRDDVGKYTNKTTRNAMSSSLHFSASNADTKNNHNRNNRRNDQYRTNNQNAHSNHTVKHNLSSDILSEISIPVSSNTYEELFPSLCTQQSVRPTDRLPSVDEANSKDMITSPFTNKPNSWRCVAVTNTSMTLQQHQHQSQTLSDVILGQVDSTATSTGLVLLTKQSKTISHTQNFCSAFYNDFLEDQESSPTLIEVSTPAQDEGQMLRPLQDIQNQDEQQQKKSSRISRFDMNKLRDRWWDIVQKHHDMIKATSANDNEDVTNDVAEPKSQQEGILSIQTNYTPFAHQKSTFCDKQNADEIKVSQSLSSSHALDTAEIYLATDRKGSTITTITSLINSVYQNNLKDVESTLFAMSNKDELIRYITTPMSEINSNSLNNTGNVNCQNDEDYLLNMGALNLSVYLNRTAVLRTVLRFLRSHNVDWYNMAKLATPEDDSQVSNETAMQSPIIIAVQHGHDECIDILFRSLYNTPELTVLFTKCKVNGSTPFHYACLKTVPMSTFQLLFECVVKASGGRSGMNPSVIFNLHKLLSIKNCSMQQTPLHLACTNGRVDIVDFVLGRIRNISTLSRLLLNQDSYQQTPLLAAIASNSMDVVMSLLMWRGNNNTTVNQRYRSTIETNSYPIPTVNSASCTSTTNVDLDNRTLSHLPSLPPLCPLFWAVSQSNSIAMVLLLLEFNNTGSETGYDLDFALAAAIRKRLEIFNGNTGTVLNSRYEEKHKMIGSVDDDEIEQDTSGLEMIRILVEAGGNPCSVPQDTEKHTTTLSNFSTSSSAIAATAVEGDSECLILLLDVYCQRLKNLQLRRRQEPRLQKQPESFFLQLETPENDAVQSSLRDALVSSLFKFWESLIQSPNPADSSIPEEMETIHVVDNTVNRYLACSLDLFRRGTYLLIDDLNRLQVSMTSMTLRPLPKQDNAMFWSNPQYIALQDMATDVVNNTTPKNEESILEAASNAMLNMRWFPILAPSSKSALVKPDDGSNTGCAFIEQYIRNHTNVCKSSCPPLHVQEIGQPDVILVSSDGINFPVHSVIISKKSQKLAAAIRFSSLSSSITDGAFQSAEDCDQKHQHLKVSVNVHRKLLRWMLEHIYHGSIVVGRFGNNRNQTDYFENLLELLIVADEFVCPSLVQECEMRLLATDYRRCFCWYCNRPSSGEYADVHSSTPRCSTQSGPSSMHQEKTFPQKRPYFVSGPSVLVKPEDALTIIAVAQQLGMEEMNRSEESSGYYTIAVRKPEKLEIDGRTISRSLIASRNDESLVHCRPMKCLQEVAIRTMLQNLASLVNNSSFLSSLNYMIIQPQDKFETDDNVTCISCGEEEQVFGFLLEILLKEFWKLNRE